MPETISSPGGFMNPVFRDYWFQQERERHEIHVNHIMLLRYNRSIRGRLRYFFAWDKDWGCRLVGGPIPKLRDLLPTFRTVRGGIRFGDVEHSDD